MFTRCPRDNTVMMICFYSVLRYLLLFLGVCLLVCLSLQTASLKLLPPPPPFSPSLSPSHQITVAQRWTCQLLVLNPVTTLSASEAARSPGSTKQ